MSKKDNFVRQDLIGKKFGYWEVLSDDPKDRNRAICKCHWCGNIYSRIRKEIKNSKHCNDCKKKRVGKLNVSWKGYGNIHLRTYSHFKNSALARNHSFNVTIEFLWELYQKQDGKCALSGLPIDFETKRGQAVGTASLDRKDCKIGYEESNVQWVHKDVNLMKWKHNEDYFLNLCKLIIEKRIDKIIDTLRKK